METSRDDFVIAIRSAFLKKGTQQRFSLLGLISFSILLLVLGSLNFKAIDYVKIAIKEVVYRSSFIVSGPENFIKKSNLKIQSHFQIYEENQVSMSELETLREKDLLNEFIISENKRLRIIIDDYLVNSNEVFARVLNDKQSPFLKSIVISKGSKHDIELGMAVLDKNYLVGKVVEVNYMSSRILLVSDINSKIPVIIMPGNVQSILSGTGGDTGSIQYFKKKSKIQKNSIVYTSGSAGMFKSGIPVGKIDNEKSVDFFSDFRQLNFVKVLSFKRGEIK